MLTITLIIVIITILISISAFNNEKTMNDLIFYPPAVTHRKQFYRFISSGFIHADTIHLAFNMITLYLFGGSVEKEFTDIFGDTRGKSLFLIMYFGALVVSLLPTYFKNKYNSQYRSLGASGAVSAVVFAGLLLSPGTKIGIFFIPPFIPGFLFGPLFLVISAYLDRKGQDNINHSAHIWGALFGVIFLLATSYAFTDYNTIELFLQEIRYYFNS